MVRIWYSDFGNTYINQYLCLRSNLAHQENNKTFVIIFFLSRICGLSCHALLPFGCIISTSYAHHQRLEGENRRGLSVLFVSCISWWYLWNVYEPWRFHQLCCITWFVSTLVVVLNAIVMCRNMTFLHIIYTSSVLLGKAYFTWISI